MPAMSKRTLRFALGVAWLIDASLQFQPYMFTRAFSDDVLAGAATGQPQFVAAPVQWAADAVGAHPFAWNLVFALLQLTIAVALISGRAIKPALAVSIVWGLSVWYLGEGLGGIAGSSAWLLTGAPGAALVYAVLSVAAWPAHTSRLPWWLPLAWASYWIGGAVLHLLNGPTRGPDLAAAISAGATGAPGWVSRLDFSIARTANSWSEFDIALLVAAAVPHRHRRIRTTTIADDRTRDWRLRRARILAGRPTAGSADERPRDRRQHRPAHRAPRGRDFR